MPVRLEPAARGLSALVASLALAASPAPAQDAARSPLEAARAGIAEARRLDEVKNPEEARERAVRWIEELLAHPVEGQEAARADLLRDAGSLAYKLRALAPARAAWDAVRAHCEATLDPDAPALQLARGNVGWIGEQMGLVREARALEEQIVASLGRKVPDDHDGLQMARANLGDTLLQLGEPDAALALFEKVAAVRRAKLPPESPVRQRAELDLACGLVGVDRLDEAVPVLEAVLAAAQSETHANALRALADLAQVHAARGDREAFRERALELARRLNSALDDARKLPWAESEVKLAELAPQTDLALSCAQGLGVFEADPKLTAAAAGLLAGTDRLRTVVYRRWERSRLAGKGRERELLAEVHLAAFVTGGEGPARWLDLGPLDAVCAATQRWHDAVSGSAQADEQLRGEELAQLVLTPVLREVGEPGTLTIVPDDVVWAIPFAVLPHRGGRLGDFLGIDLRCGPPSPARPRTSGPACVVYLEPDLDGEVTDPPGGAAASLVPGRIGPGCARAEAWLLSVQSSGLFPDLRASRGALCALATPLRLLDLSVPAWSAPEGVPCVTTPRGVLARSPLAAALAREDVFGGSSPRALCGYAFAGARRPADADGRVRGVATAEDLARLRLQGVDRVILDTSPPRTDVRSRARDIEALVGALHESGAARVVLPVWSCDPERVPDLARTIGPFDSDDWFLTQQRALRAQRDVSLRDWGGWIEIEGLH